MFVLMKTVIQEGKNGISFGHIVCCVLVLYLYLFLQFMDETSLFDLSHFVPSLY